MLRPIFPKPEDYGDLFLDIADAYMENSEISIGSSESSQLAHLPHILPLSSPRPSPPSPLPTHTVEHSKALPLLSALVNTNKYSQAGVWLKYAECLQVLNDLEGAAMAFSNVLVLAPHHTETRCSRLNFEINQSEGQIFSNLIR